MALDLLDITGFLNLYDYFAILNNPEFEKIALAIAAIFIGIILANILGRIILLFKGGISVEGKKALSSFSRLLELFIIILSIIIALNFLEVNPAQVISKNLLDLTPNVIILLLLLFLSFIVINLVIDLIKAGLLKIGLDDYLEEVGISLGFLNNTFFIVKIFLFLILFSASFQIAGLGQVPFINESLIAIIYGFVLVSVALVYYVFKNSLLNFFSGVYIEKNILKPGQTIVMDDEPSEVVSVSAHGTLLKLTSGYNVLVPNKDVVEKKIYFKRTKQDIGKLETLRSKFVCQLPSYCGPASASMLLSFFGYDIPQETIGKIAGTKAKQGTGPRKLIQAVKRETGNNIKGVLISYDEIVNLKSELKTWLSEGALAVLWFNKPAIFRSSKGRGHYVLCVGIEEDELIILDPSKATAGVYMIDYRLFEEAMSKYDKKRGYIIFAKRGTSAYWRINEGLVYSNIEAYRELSKSFERYLKKLIRKNETIHNLLSEHVFNALRNVNSPKRLWKPEFESAPAEKIPAEEIKKTHSKAKAKNKKDSEGSSEGKE
jgi:hypothetical protein